MRGKILAHIAGFPNMMQIKFIKLLKKIFQNITIVNLDKITEKIMEDPIMKSLCLKLNEIETKKNIKEIETKINEYWKAKFDDSILIELSKNNIICVGLSTYYKNHKIGVKLLTPVKLFIELDVVENAKKVISNNLEKYYDDIIDGVFDLDYLNLHYLVDKRNNLISIYDKLGYKMRNEKNIINTLVLMMREGPKHLYFAELFEMVRGEINKKNWVAYTMDWMAIASLLDCDFGFKRDGTKYIKLRTKDIPDEVYLYKTDDTDVFLPNVENLKRIYVYERTGPMKHFDYIKIRNPLDELARGGVKII